MSISRKADHEEKLATGSPIKTGTLAEAKVLTALLEAGYDVALPFGGRGGYDLIWDTGKTLHRVQCKAAHIRGGVMVFKVASMQGAKSGKRLWLGYGGRADVFGVYCRATGLVYLIPIADVPGKECRLRIAPALNAQAKHVRWARDYILEKRAGDPPRKVNVSATQTGDGGVMPLYGEPLVGLEPTTAPVSAPGRDGPTPRIAPPSDPDCPATQGGMASKNHPETSTEPQRGMGR